MIYVCVVAKEAVMAQGYSKTDLLKFLDFMADKGLMKKSTAASRKAAINTLLSILENDELADLRGLDIDAVVQRFSNLKPLDMKPASLGVYRSRLASSLDELERYNRDPTGYKPNVSTKRVGKVKAAEASNNAEFDRNIRSQKRQTEAQVIDEVETIVFPIPLRPGIIVKVSGIPSDLLPEEAEKIGSVILALSGSQES